MYSKVKIGFGLVLLFVVSYRSGSSQTLWKMQPTSIQTRWAKHVTTKTPLPEHPRPQMMRSNWMNLNGLWDYAISAVEVNVIPPFEGKILVPYPIESALSGVKKSIQPEELLWYRRNISRPTLNFGERVLLHFGAVDFDASIYINGKDIGNHKGGYQNFSFDITDGLTQANNELIVKVWDPSDRGYNPHGKQVLNPSGIMYTPSSGIWQTVWMEKVPAQYISGLKITPDIDASLVKITVNAETAAPVEIQAAGKTVKGYANAEIVVPISNAKLWSPDAPNLYDLKVTLGTDVVKSYFGMRKIEVRKDDNGIERIFLNNKYTYNLGTLDQGFWPEGLYTAPTDEALKFDIEAAKAMGFNTIRKHIKIEPSRWYYHADRLGMLVWQDMVNPVSTTQQGKRQFERENEENVTQLYNHPSIVCWVLFNENWGAYDQTRLTETIKILDSTRIVNGHSGSLIVNYNSEENTPKGLAEKSASSDMTDIHSYPPPGMPAYISGKAMVLGEFGGIGVSVVGHLWDDIAAGWGYGGTVGAGTLRSKYSTMTDSLVAFERRGLSGSIYTQPFDVEGEQNGLMTYDREIVKLSLSDIRDMNAKLWPTTANYTKTSKDVAVKVIRDTAKQTFKSAYKAYKAGKIDSVSLRELALLAAEEKDLNSKGGRLFANEYIALIKDTFSFRNLKFIEHFTKGVTDQGFPILYENLELVNSFIGKDAAELRVVAAIEADEITPLIEKNDLDWSSLEQRMSFKYGSLGKEAVLQAKTFHALNAHNWKLFVSALEQWHDSTGIQRKWIGAEMLNNLAWATFENVDDPKALNIALLLSEQSLRTDSAAHRIDTYANLLYKLGRIDEAIQWEQRAIDLMPDEPTFQETIKKMNRAEKTWPGNN